MAKKKYNIDDVYKNFLTTGETGYKKEYEKENETLIQRSYYLTPDLVKAITLKTAESNVDKSTVVREALKMYLADILKKIQGESTE